MGPIPEQTIRTLRYFDTGVTSFCPLSTRCGHSSLSKADARVSDRALRKFGFNVRRYEARAEAD